MSFVKDDHSYTRGVGAVAAMDAVSSKRRRAAALGAVRMARRDRAMARHTLGRINQVETGDGGGSGGGGGGGTTTPVPPRFPIRTGIRDAIAIALPSRGILVKDPGTIIAPPRPQLDPVVSSTPTPTAPPPPAPPPKPTITITAAPGISPIVSAPKPTVSVTMPEFDAMPDVTIDTAPEPPPAKASNNNVLLYAALGLGALYLLTRNR